MDKFEEVKERTDLKEYAAQHLQKSRGGHYCCPACGSGTHGGRDSDGALSVKDEKSWKCFSCGARGDIFDLAGILNDTTDKTEQLQIVADWAGVTIDRECSYSANRLTAATTPSKDLETKKGTATPKIDYSAGRERHRAYIAECAKRLKDACELDFPLTGEAYEVVSYLEGRGISREDAVALGLGYDPNPAHGWQDEAGEWHRTPRLVIPWAGCDYYHIDRAIDSRAKNLKYDKPPSSPDESRGVTPDMCVGEQPLYNPQAFDHDYIIVVEGAIDAMTLHLCGFNAVALGGTAAHQFATEAAARNYSGVVIDMLDADGNAQDVKNGKGRYAGEKLVSLMADAGITCLSRAEYGVGAESLYGQVGTAEKGYKDAGEWYAADPQYLTDFMGWAVKIAREKGQEAKEVGYREAMRHLNAKDPASIALDVLEMRGIYEPIPTGFKALDDALGGGLSLGETTFFGAVSSYGKTTLTVQIADHIASAGRSVLFVTIEQSAKEIVAKSLSRLVYTENATGWNVSTPQDITSLRTRRAWGSQANDTLRRAVEDYRRLIAPNMRILEGGEQPTVNDIRAIALAMKEHDGEAPVIFIDYLQLLAPLSERYDTDKRNADRNVSELRKLARDLNTHVWCISSLNRSSYSGVIALDSFKESGGIEYGADNLIGLQPRNMAEQLDGVSDVKMKRTADKIVKENKAKIERDCELVLLKQRNGALPGEPLPLCFKPMCAYFTEQESEQPKKSRRMI